MHCGQLPALLLPPLSPEKDRGRAGPGRDGPGREAAPTAARGSGPPSAALSRPRPRSAPAPGDAPPRAAASAAAAAAAAGTEQVRRGEARRGGARPAGRAGVGEGAPSGDPSGLGLAQLPVQPSPAPPPCAGSVSVSTRAGTLAYTAWAASRGLERRPAARTYPRSPACAPEGAAPRCSASHGPYGFTLLALLTVLSAVSMTPLPCPQSLGSSQQPPYLLPHPSTVPGSPSHSPVPSSPVMLILHLSLSRVPPLILSPLVPSVPLCPLPHLSAPVPITPHRSPTLLSTWAPTFLCTPGLHLAQVHINTYMCICHDELPATWVHPPPHIHIIGPTLSYTHSR